VRVGEDIARDLATCAREVIMSAKTWMKESYASERGPLGTHGNIYRRPWPQHFLVDGSIVFEDDTSVSDVDVAMFCTGPSSLNLAHNFREVESFSELLYNRCASLKCLKNACLMWLLSALR
jgi:hypothetical protein